MATRKPKQRRSDGFEIYDGNGPRAEYFWRLVRRGRIVADGSEGYTRLADAKRAVRGVSKWLRGAVPVTVITRDKKR